MDKEFALRCLSKLDDTRPEALMAFGQIAFLLSRFSQGLPPSPQRALALNRDFMTVLFAFIDTAYTANALATDPDKDTEWWTDWVNAHGDVIRVERLEALRGNIADMEALAHAAVTTLEDLPYLSRQPQMNLPPWTEDQIRSVGRIQSLVLATANAAKRVHDDVTKILNPEREAAGMENSAADADIDMPDEEQDGPDEEQDEPDEELDLP